MSSSSPAARYWISAWLPVALGIVIIVAESTAYFGADHTSGPLRWLFQLLFGRVSDAHWAFIHHIIRKSGHFLGYGAIGLAWLRAWRMTLTAAPFHTDAALALLGTTMLASWDEWHQGFLPNRTSSPWDVLLDCCGAVVMLSFAWILRRNSWRKPSPQAHRTTY